jgi:SAM-dependent methyltransferase
VSRNFQEAFYTRDVDYTIGSPHLTHRRLRDRLVALLREAVEQASDSGLPPRVLEIGAGHGGYTETALALGCEVTAVEMSGQSVDVLRGRFGSNPRLSVVHDPVGDLAGVGNDYALVLAVSVLHHIPDYVSFLTRAADHVAPGGGILALQDPLWYPRMPRVEHLADRAGFLVWRLGHGNVGRGFASLSRRLRHSLDETKLGDMVEYHVVRHGVDELSIKAALEKEFGAVDVVRYWSHQAGIMQRLGERAGWANTFAVWAADRRSGFAGDA